MSVSSLLLIDGHSFAYRAYFALPPENFSTSTGQTTNAVYGFLSMLLTVLENERPDHVAVAFDLGRQTFRLDEYPEYKAGRARTPEDFPGQVDLIQDMLRALNIPVLTREGFEADDILATLARQATDRGVTTQIASGDKDSFQLASDTVTILYPKRGVSELNRFTPQAVENKYGVTPANYRGLAALVGEKADNLPGVPGVGDKTAAKWLAKYGDLDAIIDNAEDIGGKVGQSLRDHLDDVKRNYRLNKLVEDLDLDIDPLDTQVGEGAHHDQVTALFDQLEFRQLAERVNALFFADVEQVPQVELPEVVATSGADLPAWLDAAEEPVGFALEDDTLGLASNDSAIWVDLTDLDEKAFSALDTFLSTKRVVAHDVKPQVHAWVERGFTQPRPIMDTELAAYLIAPDARGYSLADMASDLGVVLEEDRDLLTDVGEQLGHRAWVTVALYPRLRQDLERNHVQGVLDDIEMPTQEILARMEIAGIAIDQPVLNELIAEFEAAAQQSASEAYASIGHEVNLNSPKQLQTVLFDELNMPKTKRTKTGYTTDADSLADLLVKTQHPFLEHLLAHRDRTKLKQTVVGLQKVVADDGRIHTTYLQTVAATGRLSSKDPNLQNIPVRTEAGRRIRSVFQAAQDDGYESLMSVDYSQIEMRIMAHLSGDEALIQAFKDGEDLHRYVAGQVFDVPIEDVTDQQRSKVKAMSYGLVYGLSAYGLSRQLGIPTGEASALMDDYFARFGAVKEYLDQVVEEARGRGYTETMYGRRRYLPQLRSDRRQLREMAERAALNAPIQGSAADIMKIAMKRVDDALQEAGLKSRMLLQVHDEIILEIWAGEATQVEKLVRENMSQAAQLSVPLDVNVGVGPNWQDAAH